MTSPVRASDPPPPAIICWQVPGPRGLVCNNLQFHYYSLVSYNPGYCGYRGLRLAGLIQLLNIFVLTADWQTRAVCTTLRLSALIKLCYSSLNVSCFLEEKDSKYIT